MNLASSFLRRWSVPVLLGIVISAAAWSYAGGGILAILFDPHLGADSRLEAIRSHFEAWGLAAPLVYAGLVVLETVIAPIPGVLLYLPGGAVFGWAIGGSAALAGNIVGSGVACIVARRLAGDRVLSFLNAPALGKYKGFIETRGFWIVLLLRINPLTSSDIVSYAAGMTTIPAWQIMAATAIGMAPLCFLQAYFAQELFTVFPMLIYPLTLVAVTYAAYIVRMSRRARTKVEWENIMAKKVEKSEQEWKEQLTPNQYNICRMKGTEPPFTGEYYKTKTPGTYACSCCGAELFDSQTKYESGSGWPSFYQPSIPENIESKEDISHGMRRTEVRCNACGAHLGHVFEDGPQPTGMRYCINSASLKLKPKEGQ